MGFSEYVCGGLGCDFDFVEGCAHIFPSRFQVFGTGFAERRCGGGGGGGVSGAVVIASLRRRRGAGEVGAETRCGGFRVGVLGWRPGDGELRGVAGGRTDEECGCRKTIRFGGGRGRRFTGGAGAGRHDDCGGCCEKGRSEARKM